MVIDMEWYYAVLVIVGSLLFLFVLFLLLRKRFIKQDPENAEKAKRLTSSQKTRLLGKFLLFKFLYLLVIFGILGGIIVIGVYNVYGGFAFGAFGITAIWLSLFMQQYKLSELLAFRITMKNHKVRDILKTDIQNEQIEGKIVGLDFRRVYIEDYRNRIHEVNCLDFNQKETTKYTKNTDFVLQLPCRGEVTDVMTVLKELQNEKKTYTDVGEKYFLAKEVGLAEVPGGVAILFEHTGFGISEDGETYGTIDILFKPENLDMFWDVRSNLGAVVHDRLTRKNILFHK